MHIAHLYLHALGSLACLKLLSSYWNKIWVGNETLENDVPPDSMKNLHFFC